MPHHDGSTEKLLLVLLKEQNVPKQEHPGKRLSRQVFEEAGRLKVVIQAFF